MKTSAKVILVITGYIAAPLLALLVTSLYIASTNGPDRQTYGAMYDFGDSILFVLVCGLGALPATGLALFFLRRNLTLWRTLAGSALIIAATGLIELAAYFLVRSAPPASLLGTLAEFSPLRFFLTPIFAVAFLVGAVLAPTRFTRLSFIGTALAEVVVFVCIALTWFLPYRS